jgi:hypothetical protein
VFLNIIYWSALALVILLALLILFEPPLRYSVRGLSAATNSKEFLGVVCALAGAEMHPYSRVESLTDGKSFYPAELEAIRNAVWSVHIEVFIFRTGDIGDRFLAALVERARNGVQVKVVVDAFGSFLTPDNYFQRLRDAGGEVRWYQPFRLANFKRWNNRTHRKLITIDGTIGFIGGAGIARHWDGGDNKHLPWRDMMFKLEGPLVTGLQSTFAENWLESSGEILANPADYLGDAVRETPGTRGMVVMSTPTAGSSSRTRILFQVLLAGAGVSKEDMAFLGTIARRTWRFFEAFASAADNYLPPDNFQEQPPGGIAHRTSPTNIGLALLSNLAAYDFGYIPVSGVIERTTQTLDTLNKLERYRGHFYNWYDTQTLKPLIPAYVSTVDSGNLAGHLLTLAAGLDELSSGKLFCPVVFTGLDSVLQLLIDAASESSSLSLNNQTSGLKRLQASVRTPPRTLSNSRNLLRQISWGIEVATATSKLEVDAEWHWWVAATQRQCAAFAEELDQLAPWLGPVQPADIMQFSYIRDALAQIGDVPTLADVAGMEAVIVKAIDTSLGSSESNGVLQQFRAKVVAASELAAKRVGELRQLAVRCRELAEIEYGFPNDRPDPSR